MMRQTYSLDDFILVPRYSELQSRDDGIVESCGYDLPIVMSPMDTVTTQQMIKYFVDNNLMATVHRYFNSCEQQFEFVKQIDNIDYKDVFFAIGSIKKHKKWIDYLINQGVNRFCVDMAHGDCQLCIDTVVYLKANDKVKEVIAGNVVTKSGFERLQEAGADYIRVGIGNGSICSTRIQCGVGLPQGTAIEDCASRKTTAKLIADGGIKTNGDIAKAISIGADMVMCGKMLASTDLAAGETYCKDKCTIAMSNHEIYYKEYHGMASVKAREGVVGYGSVEGRSGLIRYKGLTSEMLMNLKLNLKASQSYVGVTNWRDFRLKSKKVMVSNSGIIESQTHLAVYDDI